MSTELTEEEIAALKVKIDALSQEEMARLWRFAPVGHPYFTPPLGEYFQQRLQALGGFTPAISKALGWGDGGL